MSIAEFLGWLFVNKQPQTQTPHSDSPSFPLIKTAGQTETTVVRVCLLSLQEHYVISGDACLQ